MGLQKRETYNASLNRSLYPLWTDNGDFPPAPPCRRFSAQIIYITISYKKMFLKFKTVTKNVYRIEEKTLASMPFKLFIEFFFPLSPYLWKTAGGFKEGNINIKEKTNF